MIGMLFQGGGRDPSPDEKDCETGCIVNSKLSSILLPMQGTLQVHILQVLIQHVETYDEENMRDFVDVYLKEIASSKDPSFNGELLLETPIPMNQIDQALLQRSSCW